MLRVRIVLVALVAVLVAVACSHEPRGPGGDLGDRGTRVSGGAGTATTPEIPADAPLVIFLGDSISAGLHLPASAAFPAVLQRKLAAEGHPFRLVNAGVSGDTTSGGLSRLDWVLQQKPDVLVVELGGNDGLRGLPVEEIEKNLRAIRVRAGQARARVILLGVRMPTSYGAYATQFDAIYPRIAADSGIAFVPYFMEGVGGVPDMLLEDGLHPTAAGHEIIAARIASVLTQAVAQPHSR